MNYRTETPLDVEHVIAVIGHERLLSLFHLPVSEWGLTDREITRIKAGPHGYIAVYLVNDEFMGFPLDEMTVECECGDKFAARLLSHAMREYDTHAGNAPISHTITAEMLEA